MDAVLVKRPPAAPLRLVPVRVMQVPTKLLVGLRLMRVGANTVVFNSTAKLLLKELVSRASGLPSPFTSATATLQGMLPVPVEVLTTAAKVAVWT